MRKFLLLFVLPVLMCAVTATAKGHGGGGHGGGHGGGGHVGGHVGGGGHMGSRSGAGARVSGTSSMGMRNSSARSAARTTGNSLLTRTPRSTGVIGTRTTVNNIYIPHHVIGTTTHHNPGENWASYPYYYYGGYGYAPYYDPYFSMWSFGANFMYTPHYSNIDNRAAYGNNDGNSNGLYDENGPMEGYVVYEHDTITGDITMSRNTVELHTADTARGYDYKFKMKQEGLEYIAVYNNNDTTNQLNLVRLKNDRRRLYRQVHVGKLNIFDGRYGFIYRPEDIDVSSVTVVYNGQQDALNSSSINKTKEWLTEYVNRAYGLNLNAGDFSWKELLIYIDKLD